GLQAVLPVSSFGAATARADWSYRDRLYFSHFNDRHNGQAALQLWDLFFGFEHASGHAGVKAFVKNLTDEDYKVGGVIASIIIGGPAGHYAPPRTWGVELYARF